MCLRLSCEWTTDAGRKVAIHGCLVDHRLSRSSSSRQRPFALRCEQGSSPVTVTAERRRGPHLLHAMRALWRSIEHAARWARPNAAPQRVTARRQRRRDTCVLLSRGAGKRCPGGMSPVRSNGHFFANGWGLFSLKPFCGVFVHSRNARSAVVLCEAVGAVAPKITDISTRANRRVPLVTSVGALRVCRTGSRRRLQVAVQLLNRLPCR